MCQRVRGHEKGDCTRARREGGGRRGWWPSVGAQARQRMSEWRRSAGRGMRGISRLIHGRVRAGRRLEAALWRPLPLAPIGPRPDVPATAAAVTWRCPISRDRPAPAENPGLPIFADVPPPVVACGPSLPAIAGAWRCSCTGFPSLASRHRPRDGHGPRAWWGGRQHAASRDGDGGEWARGRQAADSQVAGGRRQQPMQAARLPASARAWT